MIYNYYLEKKYLETFSNDPTAREKYIEDSLKSSNQVQVRQKSFQYDLVGKIPRKYLIKSVIVVFFKKKWANPRLFLFIFIVFTL